MQCLLGNVREVIDMSQQTGTTVRFSSGQVKFHGAKFGAIVHSGQHPINHITIDKDGTVHGWIVKAAKTRKQTMSYSEFAKSVSGYMKVSICFMDGLKPPHIVDLN